MPTPTSVRDFSITPQPLTHLAEHLLRPRRSHLARALKIMAPEVPSVGAFLALDLDGRQRALGGDPLSEHVMEGTLGAIVQELRRARLWGHRRVVSPLILAEIAVPRAECRRQACEGCRARGWHAQSRMSPIPSRAALLTLASDPVGILEAESAAAQAVERLSRLPGNHAPDLFVEWVLGGRTEVMQRIALGELDGPVRDMERDWLRVGGAPPPAAQSVLRPDLHPAWSTALVRLVRAWRMWDVLAALDAGALVDAPYNTLPNPYAPLVDIVRRGYFPVTLEATVRLMAPTLDPSDA